MPSHRGRSEPADAAPVWTPDRVVDADLAAAVVAQQFPDLAGLPVRLLDAGWDNVVVTVGEDWVFRFVHREVALRGAWVEVAVLRHLADRFAVPIPHPQRIGTPTEDVPWPFWGARLLPGVELAKAGLPADARSDVARAVGGVLRELHRPELAQATTAALAVGGVALPVDPNRRSEPAVVAERARADLSRLAALGWDAPDDVVELLERAERLPPPGQAAAVLVHGDLHVRHVLDEGGRASGIIDWGDTALADPCVDLMIGYAAFDGASRAAFLDAYGPVPADRELRARAVAVRVHAALAHQTTVDGHDAVRREALDAIVRAAR